ncbi:hypothetical protein, partial [Gemmobacter lanyuensis]|uniref:hypothetical protein n=1 Tax=Gemmobacter lanyuensis TaxID=1054497 RepID=UPI001E4D97A6
MDAQEEERIILRLKLRAEGGDVDAAKLLFAERSKRVRPIRFQECQTLEELKIEFENYSKRQGNPVGAAAWLIWDRC